MCFNPTTDMIDDEGLEDERLEPKLTIHPGEGDEHETSVNIKDKPVLSAMKEKVHVSLEYIS